MGSTVHASEQPSPARVLPSSHSSPESRVPLPQRRATQFTSTPVLSSHLPSDTLMVTVCLPPTEQV
jgi:hypothetical protein